MPRVVALKPAVVVGIILWSLMMIVAAVAGLSSAGPRASEAGILLPIFLVAALVTGALSGFLDWWWNRTPYYSQLKGRWLDQKGYGFPVMGALCMGLLGEILSSSSLPLAVPSGESPMVAMGMAGFAQGVVLGVIYRIVVFVGGLSKDWMPEESAK